ncbi:MAG: DUF2786 domain-containing protein [Bacteriovoracaceae bacterium]|nr:DUF2786 domain-containing protein [Bacteriovoracaceae bacterium]
MNRSRFEYFGYTYPINLVVFEHPKTLGFFNEKNFQIGLNKKLIYSAKNEFIKNILRHELAHYLLFLQFKNTLHTPADHGSEYKDLCRGFGWTQVVWRAGCDYDQQNENSQDDVYIDKILLRVKKLMSLATSSNPYESEQATLRANQLLLKHNMDIIGHGKNSDEEEVYVKRVLTSKRNSTKLHCIYEILTHFFVQPVFNSGKGIIYLEVTGARTNVEVADYVANYLDGELEKMWKTTKRENPQLKGPRAKNSYFNGIYLGYHQKMKKGLSELKSDQQKALVLIGKDLKEKVKMVYGNTTGVASTTRVDTTSLNLGQKSGRQLSISKAINHSTSGTKYLE